MQKKYKLIIAYDGTDYFGWQAQPERPTIAGVLQTTFTQVFGGKQTNFRATSRTDAGVHAHGQVATCKTDLVIDAQKLMHAWNNILPQEIVIRSIEEVPLEYNVHADIEYKTYWYHFFQERPLPATTRYGYYYRRQVDLEKLKKCLQVFLGTHDFRSFSTGDERGEDTVRTITDVGIGYSASYNGYRISISGPKFLHYMVRRIVGASLHIASHPELNIDILKQVLLAKNPQHALPNAPAKGLTLYTIKYTDNGEKDV